MKTVENPTELYYNKSNIVGSNYGVRRVRRDVGMSQEQFTDQAVIFMQKLMELYVEQEDYPAVEAMLHPDVSLIGTGAREEFTRYPDIRQLLESRRASASARYRIVRQNYGSRELETGKYLVWGKLDICQEEQLSMDLEVNLNLVAICIRKEEKFLLYHINYHIPDFSWKMENILSEKMLNHIVGGVEICTFDESFTIEYASEGFCKMTGYTCGELQGKKHIQLVYHEDIERMKKEVREQSINTRNFSAEYRLCCKDGSVIWVLDRGTVFYQEDRQPKVQCILTDITQLKEQEEELRIEEQRFHIVLGQLEVSMFEYNIQTRQLTLFENDASLYAVPGVVENGPETLIKIGAIRPDYVEGYREMYRKIHAGEPFANCFVNTRDTDKVIHEYELTMTTIYDRDNRPVRAVGIKRDVSQMRRLQREKMFNESMVRDKKFVFEANVTTNTVLYTDRDWLPPQLTSDMPLDELVSQMAELAVEEEYKGHVRKYLSAQHINQTYAKGERLMVFYYRRLDLSGQYRWMEATVNIVQDEHNQDINIRMYIVDVDERKNKEQEAEKERLLYESMVANAIQAYEMNLTKDIFVKGYESWESLYGIEANNSYSAMIAAFCNQVIHVDDREAFKATMSRSALVQAFHEGKKTLSLEYRRCGSDGRQSWVTCATHLYEDPDTGEIRGYCYVEDIDKEKREELALKYRAEHDFLTGLYNKETCTQMIRKILEESVPERDIHGLLVIDIDHFKKINDHFGHMFGDQVIGELGRTIHTIFRSSDVVGRVGGDEFCVLLNSMGNQKNVLLKAQQLCDAIRHTYSDQDVSCDVSASIGIALYPRDGETFEELFRKADQALYTAKNKGRNQYAY